MKTHLAIGASVAFFLIPYISHKLLFIPLVLISSLLPDIDSGFSTLGKRGVFKIVQFFTKHRGIIHSFTFCLLISILLAMFLPSIALPFFLGYSFHLAADSFTVEGIKPFWPMKSEAKGFIRTGGRIENIIFIVFVSLTIIGAVSWFV